MKATSTCLTTSWWQFGQHQTTVTDAVTLLLFSPSRRSTLEPQSYTMQCQTRSVWYHPGTQHRTFCSMACDFAPFCLVVDVLCNMLCLSVGSLWSSETSSKREGSSASIQRNGLLVLSPALNVPCQRAWREFFFFFHSSVFVYTKSHCFKWQCTCKSSHFVALSQEGCGCSNWSNHRVRHVRFMRFGMLECNEGWVWPFLCDYVLEALLLWLSNTHIALIGFCLKLWSASLWCPFLFVF